MIDHLPRDSAYIEALVNDDDLAEALVDRPGDGKYVRKMSDWSPSVELLSAVLDRLGELIQAIAAMGGAKPHRAPPAPRPVTAIDRARLRRRYQKHQALAARVLPPKRPPADGAAAG